jgi:hypothetical protein
MTDSDSFRVPGRPGAGQSPVAAGQDPRAKRVYQIEITLRETHPPVWRRVLVPEDVTLSELHRVVQAAMGWADQHLWRMRIGDGEYSDMPNEGWGEPIRAARGVRLGDVAGAGDVLFYEYDFGDSWGHDIQVQKVRPAEPREELPVCTAAARACPPEDCGGVPGYERLLEVLSDPHDPEHDALLEWVGGAFDPEAVSLREINRRLARGAPGTADAGPDGSGPSSHNPAEAAMRAVRAQAEAVLQQMLSENPAATIDELSAALQSGLSGYNQRPQAELGGLSPTQMRRLLSADWGGQGSAVRLRDSLSPHDLAASPTLHNARLFLGLLGEQGTAKATPKGNLPRAFVAAMDEAMRRPERDESWDADRKVKNEEDVFQLHVLRVLLELAGLVKRRKGLFSLTRTGERLADESRAGELFAVLLRTHFRSLNLAYLDGADPLPEFQHTIAYALYRFGQVGVAWKAPLALKPDVVLPSVADAMPPGEHYDHWEIVLESRLLRPLEGFGLAEVRSVPRVEGEWLDRREYRKSALFDQVVSFELDG